MKTYDVITKKKRGEALSKEEIEFFVSGYTSGEIPDYQASALLMAICIQGMNDEETANLTLAISKSGEVLSGLPFGSVDKHSSGGVGDKTTLIVAPLVASLGSLVAKMSGRGLGHTGGTIDKLESIPGFKSELAREEFLTQARRVGIAVVAQSADLAPADKKLYALRDVTATVDSIPLICASIMGKKLASGAENIVLDVKFGSGAFMKTEAEAKRLAELMVRVGGSLGRRVRALITDMSTPLGFAVGNGVEVDEAVRVLSGKGPSDLTEICIALAAEMVSLSQGIERERATALIREALFSGKALKKFEEWISAQGGDASFIHGKGSLPKAKYERTVRAPRCGFVFETDTEGIGRCATELGAGRRKKGDSIDLSAGIILHKKRGDKVKETEPIATLLSGDESLFPEAEEILLSSYKISNEPPAKIPLISEIIE